MAHTADAPSLTVSATARRLGVARSTLRTRGRRYRIGPCDHAPGSACVSAAFGALLGRTGPAAHGTRPVLLAATPGEQHALRAAVTAISDAVLV